MNFLKISGLLLLIVLLVAACGGADGTVRVNAGLAPLVMPELAAVERESGPLRVLTTTSVIGDVVAQVGGQAIDLTVLMEAGQDPHSYQSSAGDLTAAADADLIFVNGWGLEQGLLDDLARAAGDTPLVPVSAGIVPLPFGGEDGAGSGQHAADPHTWLDPHNGIVWVRNITQALQAVDPANAATYQANAEAYLAQLDDLAAAYNEALAAIPAGQRRLVSNHDSLGYLAERYDLIVVGTVIPSASTLAEPSAGALVELVKAMETAGVCTIFTESTANEELARAAAAELAGCPSVQVLSLYTGALGPAGSPASSYLGMMWANLETLVTGLAS